MRYDAYPAEGSAIESGLNTAPAGLGRANIAFTDSDRGTTVGNCNEQRLECEMVSGYRAFAVKFDPQTRRHEIAAIAGTCGNAAESGLSRCFRCFSIASFCGTMLSSPSHRRR